MFIYKGQPFAMIKFYYYYVLSCYFMITPKTLSLTSHYVLWGRSEPDPTGPEVDRRGPTFHNSSFHHHHICWIICLVEDYC